MKTLLRIDASARTLGSHSRGLADHFQALWAQAHPGGRVVGRDLARDPVPHLDEATVAAFQGAERSGAAGSVALSEGLIEELRSVDEVLISSPLYNFALPSTLKAYLDHVVRVGRTVVRKGDGFAGLLSGKSAVVITARGGPAGAASADDFQTPYLRAILDFIGISPVRTVVLDGTADEAVRSQRVAAARAQIERIFAAPAEPEWVGPFTGDDREEIRALRAGQAAAIQRGDAEGYARLCTDDILLMVPAHDIVSGRERFLACETELFRRGRFASFVKTPERIERSGDLAVEVGRQEILSTQGDGGGVFSARQKYTHVFRKTPQGWRFSVLMSNSSG